MFGASTSPANRITCVDGIPAACVWSAASVRACNNVLDCVVGWVCLFRVCSSGRAVFRYDRRCSRRACWEEGCCLTVRTYCWRLSPQKFSEKLAALGKIQAWARMLNAKAAVEDETNFQVFTALDEDLERVRAACVANAVHSSFRSYLWPCYVTDRH